MLSTKHMAASYRGAVAELISCSRTPLYSGASESGADIRDSYAKSLAVQFADINLMDMSPISIYGMVARDQFLEYSQLTSQYLARHIPQPYLYKIGNVILLGTSHISPLWAIPQDLRSLIESQDKLYLENYQPEGLSFPAEEPEHISYYSYRTSEVKIIEDLPWFEQLSVKAQNALTYFFSIDQLSRMTLIEALAGFYQKSQSSCSESFPYPWGYEGMDEDLATHYTDRCEGLEPLESFIPMLQRLTKSEIGGEISIDLYDFPVVSRLVASYCNKNTYDLVVKLSNKSNSGLMNELIQGRTFNWMEKINTIIANGERAVIAVGAAHLFGEDGILYQLSKEGQEAHSLHLADETIVEEEVTISEMIGSTRICHIRINDNVIIPGNITFPLDMELHIHLNGHQLTLDTQLPENVKIVDIKGGNVIYTFAAAGGAGAEPLDMEGSIDPIEDDIDFLGNIDGCLFAE